LNVSGIDWSKDNKIVTCSHDRNAYVWTFEDGKWKPSLVILRIERAALDVQWSADGKKFAVASGAKCISMCIYDAGNDWWVSNIIKKKFKSTVLCCAFHPQNSQVIATGASDFRCRIYSSFASEVDGMNLNSTPFSRAVEFGECYCELTALGWVHAISWAPSGNVLAYASHDSSIHFAMFPSSGLTGDPPVVRVLHKGLPFTSLTFISDDALVCAGHDMVPQLFTASGNGWKYGGSLTKGSSQSDATTTASTEGTGSVAAARALFKAKTSRGQTSGAAAADVLKTLHESTISSVKVCGPGKIASTAFDGRIIVWDLKTSAASIEGAMAALKL
jgi:actin related protein 2/3 complex, subunit 1A/1B